MVSDLSNKIIADLKAELAESKAAANRVTESMGSEILRLQGEMEQRTAQLMATQTEMERQRALVAERDCTIIALVDERDQQRTRAEAVEQELREEKAHADGMSQAAARLLDKRDAIRAHLAGVDVAKLGALVKGLPDAPWKVVEHGDWWRVVRPELQKDEWSHDREVFDDGSACGEYGPTASEATRDGIIAIRNAADALLAAAREALEP